MFKRGIMILILVLIQTLKMAIEARPADQRCSPCPRDGCPVPEDCPHGTIVDSCGRVSCAKGPGEKCKIRRFRIQGNCGQGMYCHCGVCEGCSLFTFECFEQTCVVPIGSG